MGPVGWIALAGYASLEYWLGKTKLVKPGSSLELGLSILRVVTSVALRGKK